jgi:hypothetical protein
MPSRPRVARWVFLTALALVLAHFGPGEAAQQKAQKKARPATPPTTASVAPAAAKLDSPGLARHIDQSIDARLKAEKVDASPVCDDAEFIRRVYLDLTGRIPPADKVAAFLDSREPDRRARLIDELLASSDFGKHQADVWQALLLPRTSDNRRLNSAPLVRWLEESFNANKPWDGLVRDLLTATGEPDKNGAVTYFLSNPTPDKLTDNVTRLFLGVQLQCAQCHNHPFTDWKQDAYWGMAAFFTKVRIQGNPRAAAQRQGNLGVNESGTGRPLRLPDSAKRLPPRFLQGEQPSLAAGAPYRPALADWMVSPKNPFFSRAMVNRTWAQLFGRGLVNPVDDMHDGNPPSHPELLAELSRQFAANSFDVKYLYRAICNSSVYQRTSRPAGNNVEAGAELFARMAVKVMTPEQLFDSLTRVLGNVGGQGPGRRQGAQARLARGPREAFVAFFGVEDGSDPTEYQGGIPQVLRLMNSPPLNNAAMLAPLLEAHKTPAEVIEHLFLATLSRRPSPAESQRLTAYVRSHGENRQAYTDVLWVLLNTSEFTLNH